MPEWSAIPGILATWREQPLYATGKYVIESLHPMLVIFPLVCFTGLILNRKFRSAIFLLFSTLCYGLIIIIVYHQGESNLMLENIFLPVLIFPSLLVLREIWLAKRLAGLQFLGWTIIFILFASRISYQKAKLDYKHAWLENMIHYGLELDSRKIILDIDRVDEEFYGLSWAMGAESMLLSTIDFQGRSVAIHPTNDPPHFLREFAYDYIPYTVYWPLRGFVDEKGLFDYKYGPMLYLNENLAIEAGEFTYPENGFDLDLLQLSAGGPLELEEGKSTSIFVKVTNKSDYPLVSNQDSPYACQFYWRLGKEQKGSQPLEVNILPHRSYVCHLKVNAARGLDRDTLRIILENGMYPDRKYVETFPVEYY